MKFFTELLGFAVLGSPFWLIVILVPVCVWLAVKISKSFKPGITRLMSGVGIFFLLFTLPFGDEVAGRIYFNYLCANEAGVKVYQAVELPAEYWDEQGRARFIAQERSLEFNQAMLGGRYSRKNALYRDSKILRIDRHSYQLFDEENKSVIGENVDFMFWGGWVRANFSVNNAAMRCSREQAGYFTDLLKAVFRVNN